MAGKAILGQLSLLQIVNLSISLSSKVLLKPYPKLRIEDYLHTEKREPKWLS